MAGYVEFPVDLLTQIVLPKKPDDPGEWTPGGTVPGPCGRVETRSPLQERAPDFMVLLPGGLYYLRPGFDTDGTQHVIWHQSGRFSYITDPVGLKPYNYDEVVDYYWYIPASWTVTIVSRVFDSEVLINVYRNRDPTTFNPCTQSPDDGVSAPGGGTASIDVLTQNPSEDFPPMVFVMATNTYCDQGFADVFIQAHCAQETSGAPATPPNGWPANQPPGIIDVGLPTGDSWFLTNTNPFG